MSSRIIQQRIEIDRPQPSEPAPLVAGKYRVVSKLGSGGSATVSLALQQGIAGFSKLVVLKAIRDTVKAGSSAIDGFLDEARLSARLNHPNVVQVYEVVEHAGLPVIVMEYLDGQPLASLLAEAYDRPEFTPEVRLTIVTKVLAGLHHAHELCDFSGRPLGLVHRDVSPHNVMVTYDGQVKLVDFGIAQLGSERPPRSKRVPGKLAYMAPEQMHGVADRRADVFAAGILLWELITLRRFWGTQSEPAVMRQLLAFDIPHRQALKPEMDDDLAAICSRALAADPRERYSCAVEMQADLERFLVLRSGVVIESTIGQLVQRGFRAERARSQRALRARLAELDGPLVQGYSEGSLDEGQSHESLATVETLAPTHCDAGCWSRVLGAAAAAAFICHAGDTLPLEGVRGPHGVAVGRAFLTAHDVERDATAPPVDGRPAAAASDTERPAAVQSAPPPDMLGMENARAAPAAEGAASSTPSLTPALESHAPARPTPARPPSSRPPSLSGAEKPARPRAAKAAVAPSIELEPGSDLRRLRRAPASDQRVSGRGR